jgi:hypothetical protein
LIFPGTLAVRLLNREDAKDAKEEVGSRKKEEVDYLLPGRELIIGNSK